MTMNLDPSSALADKFKGKRQVLESAVLGKVQGIDPYSALRALQKLNVADKYEQMQKAMAGQQNAPSVAQQTLAQAAQARAPQPPMQAPAPQQGAGLAGMPLPQGAMSMAGGGIVAFSGEDGVSDVGDGEADGEASGVDTPESQAAQAQVGEYLAAMQNMNPEKATTEDEYAAATANALPGLRKLFKSTEYYDEAQKNLGEMEQDRTASLEQHKGLAALQAAAAMLQGNNAARGLAGGAAAFGQAYGAAADAAAKEKQSLAKMRLDLANAQRAEDMGLYKMQASNLAAARQDKRAADLFNLNKVKAEGYLAAQLAKAKKAPAVPAGRQDVQSIKNYLQAHYKDMPDVDAEAKAVTIVKQLTAGQSVAANKAKDISAQVQKRKITDSDNYRKLVAAIGEPAANAQLEREESAKWDRVFGSMAINTGDILNAPPAGGPSKGAEPPPPPNTTIRTGR